jgi:hypothetical protein
MGDKEKKVKVDDLDPREVKPSEGERLRGGLTPRGQTSAPQNDVTDSGSTMKQG